MPRRNGRAPRKSIVPRPPWDENFNSTTEFKATEEELRRRHEAHKSKNSEKVRTELRRSKSGDLDFSEVLGHLSYSEPKLYHAEPLVTPAPGGSPVSEGCCRPHSRAEPLHWNPGAPSLYNTRQMLRQTAADCDGEEPRKQKIEDVLAKEVRHRQKLEAALTLEIQRRQKLEEEVSQMRVLLQELTKDVIALNTWRQQLLPAAPPPTPAIPLGPPIRFIPSPDSS